MLLWAKAYIPSSMGANYPLYDQTSKSRPLTIEQMRDFDSLEDAVDKYQDKTSKELKEMFKVGEISVRRVREEGETL